MFRSDCVRWLFALSLALAVPACGDDGDGGDADASASDGGGNADAPSGADGGSGDAGVLARCESFGAVPVDEDRQLDSGGRTRDFAVHVPASYNPQLATPVVFNFHGFGSNGGQQALLAEMNSKADAEGFIAVHADGVVNSWNGGACCGTASNQDVDDVAFVSDMIDELASYLCVDPARVYSTGLSNGGFLSHRLACELSGRIAGIAPVAGVIGVTDCQPAVPVPVMHFHGTSDTIVPYNGSTILGYGSAPDTYNDWSARNGCSGQETTYDEGDSTCVSALGCTGGATVSLCTVDGGGHNWPGGLGTGAGADINATDAMWDFFEAHRHPSPAPLP